MWAFFVFVALACYTSGDRRSRPRLLGTLAAVACALLSKETAVCIAGLLPLMDWSLGRAERVRRQWPAYVGVVAILIAYLLTRREFASVDSRFLATPSEYFLKQLVSTPYRFFAQPWSVSAVDVPPAVACLVAVCVLLALWMAIVRGISPRVLTGPAVVLLATAPLVGYFFVRNDLTSARYLYLPAFGWSLIVAWIVTTVCTSDVARLTASMILACSLALALTVNLRPWRTVGQTVNAMAAAVKQTGDPSAVLTPLRERHAGGWIFKDGIPTEFGGVGVFINGYPEFLRRQR